MNTEEYVITAEGLDDLKSELEHLRSVRLPKVSEALNHARGFGLGDIEDNAEYKEALKEHTFVMGRILTLEHVLNRAKVVRRSSSDERIVSIGSRITVCYTDGTEEVYHVVGSAEVNRVQGQLSNDSPVGQALMGKKEGDKIEVIVPSGTVKLEIIAIS
jgi:transcription elongation factor GreA